MQSACQARVASAADFVTSQWQLTRGQAAKGPDDAPWAPLDAMTMSAWNTNINDPHAGLWHDNRYPLNEQPQTLDVGTSFEVSSLMPSNWKSNKGPSGFGGACGSVNNEQEMWAKYSPSKNAYENYLSAVGSSRLSLVDRSSYGRIIGQRNLLMQSAPVPISSQAFVFNDSSARQQTYYQATSHYPTVC